MSFIAGLLLLFIIYHFPEFFQAFWIAALFKISFLAAALLLARMQGWQQVSGYGLKWHKWWWRNLLAGLILGIGFFLLSEAAAAFFTVQKINSIDPATAMVSRLPMILLITFFPSIAEDILTRGYLFGHLRHRLQQNSFVLLSAAFFVLNHIWRLQDGTAVLTYLFVLGLALAYALWHTRSLWLTLGIHWGANVAFESVTASVQSQPIHPTTAHWILAGSYVLLLLAIVVLKKFFPIA